MTAISRAASPARITGLLLALFLFVPIPTSTLASQFMSSRTPWASIVFVSIAIALVLPRASGRRYVSLSLLAVVLTSAGLTLKVGTNLTNELGFRGCYQIQSPIHPDGFRKGSCEATYDWFRPEDGTRFDEAISFGTLSQADGGEYSLKNTNWNLSAVNHRVYDYYDWDPRVPLRERLPLTAYWAGMTSDTAPIEVTYIGEGVIRSGDQTVPFVPTYSTPNTVLIENRSDQDIFIQYTWNPPEGTVDAPFAAISLTDVQGNKIRPAISPIAQFLLTVSSLSAFAGIVIIWILAINTFRSEQTKRHGPRRSTLALLVLGFLWVLSLLIMNRSVWGPAITVITLMAVFAASSLYLTRVQARIMAAALISTTAIAGVIADKIPWSYVPVLRGGDDFLGYESFAREILITGSLRAGEDVFYFAPGVRYSIFILHTLFGDGNTWIWVISIVALLVAAWLTVDRILVSAVERVEPSLIRVNPIMVLVGVLAALGLGLLIGSDVVWRSGVVLLSEFPTWPALVIALVLALTSRGRTVTLLGVGILLGFALAHRSNQAIGIGAIALAAFVVALTAKHEQGIPARKVALGATVFAPLIAVAGLIPLHNWFYGRRLVFTHDPQVVGLTTVVQPSDLLQGNEAWSAAWQQIQGLLLLPASDFPIPYDASLALHEYASALSPTGWAARMLQLALLITLVLAALRVPGTRWKDLLLLAVPLGFFLPHVFLNLSTYYPRHTVAGYLTLAVVLMTVSTRWLLRSCSQESLSRRAQPGQPAHGASR